MKDGATQRQRGAGTHVDGIRSSLVRLPPQPSLGWRHLARQDARTTRPTPRHAKLERCTASATATPEAN